MSKSKCDKIINLIYHYFMSDSIYKCPVCSERLLVKDRSLECINRHLFDKSSTGYTNLLMSNEKSSKHPGDSKEMLIARRCFLEKGYYSKLPTILNNLINKSRSNQKISLLDIGCGEGYYTNFFRQSVDVVYAFDISKSAVQMAAKKYKDINLAVASSYKLPYLSNSIDIAVCIFSPYSLAEIERVLKPGGMFILVDPGKLHLKEFMEKVSGRFKEHAGNTPVILEGQNLKLIDLDEIKYEIFINSKEDAINLLAMTPYYWTLTMEQQENLQNFTKISTQVNFRIHTIRKI